MAHHLQPDPDTIADCVLNTFNALSPKFKPRELADGRREWVPLAGIVLSKGDNSQCHRSMLECHADINFLREDRDTSLTCVCLATGMKCLPREKVPLAKGNVLHDWHAEILCLRGFNRWIIDECAELVAGIESEWIRRREQNNDGSPFALREDVHLHMYCSEAPCGDASMELIMAEQDDATPWTSQAPPTDDGMPGRGHFDQLGIVRRKPSRPDAPVCWSKSCSDKIAMKQCTGLLCGLASLLVHTDERCYLETLILPENQCVPKAVERAFGKEGRMASLVTNRGSCDTEGFFFRPFTVKTTKREFDFSKRAAGAPMASNLSALYTPRRREVLINGVLQGRKQMDPKGASCVSRRRMWESVLESAEKAGMPLGSIFDGRATYSKIKTSEALEKREQTKRDVRERALKGWKRNDGDEYWSLDQSIDN